MYQSSSRIQHKVWGRTRHGMPVLIGNTRSFPAASGIKVLTGREWLTSRLVAPAAPRGLQS